MMTVQQRLGEQSETARMECPGASPAAASTLLLDGVDEE
jgi:hypothetical protein